MSFAITTPAKFDRDITRLAKKYASRADNFAALLTELRSNLQSDLGRDCFKVRIRIATKNKGKNGGARIFTCVKVVGETIFLLTIYDKAEQESSFDQERDELLRENGLV